MNMGRKYFSKSTPQQLHICTIMYPSGTSDDPKGVVITHENIAMFIRGLDIFMDQFQDKSLERAKSGVATMEWSCNGSELRGNEVAKEREHGKGAAKGSDRGYGSSDNAVASHEEKVSRVNERLPRVPKIEHKDVTWLMSLLDGLSIPTSSVGKNAELKITSELKNMKFRECSSDEKDFSQRVC